MTQATLIQFLLNETQNLQNKAKAHLDLSAIDLQRRPSEKAWNSLECYEHMNRFGRLYIRYTGEAIAKALPREGDPGHKQGWLGGWAVRSMEPQDIGTKSPMRTLKAMDPQGAQLEKKVIHTFIKQQEQFSEILKQCRSLDVSNVKCRITLPLLKFKLADALHFNTNHNRRHMLQIERIFDGGAKP